MDEEELKREVERIAEEEAAKELKRPVAIDMPEQKRNSPVLIIGGLLISFVGQLGDLAESCWKRSIGIKDSSNIIPGHGGILDRFDSLLFASPILFFYLKYFIFK